jgi:hypothetical protein
MLHTNRRPSLVASSLAASAALVLSLAGTPAARADRSSDDPRARIERALSQIERVPTRAELLAISPRAERVLVEIARGGTAHALARSRAITALRHFPSETTAAVLAGVVRKNRGTRPGVALLDLEEALVSYAAVAGAASIPLVRPFLAHENVDVRAAAVDAIGSIRGIEARRLLVERRTVETSGSVRKQIDRRLEALDRTQGGRSAAGATEARARLRTAKTARP